jgi:outer membrane protein assembly factor BamB
LPQSPEKPTVFFGDSSGFTYALDGESGKQIWKLQPEEHPASKATATPVFYRGSGIGLRLKVA